MQTHSCRIRRPSFHVVVVLIVLCGTVQPASGAQAQSFHIPAGPLDRGLCGFSLQSKLQVLYEFDAVEELASQVVRGTLDVVEPLSAMLCGTCLRYQFVNANTVAITGTDSTSKISLRPREHSTPTNAGQDQRTARLPITHLDPRAVPETLVREPLLMYSDIERAADDIHPYVVLDQEEIAKSAVSDVEEFFKDRLPMRTTVATRDRVATQFSENTDIKLGFGPDQTLVLVGGRRVLTVTYGAESLQPDINGIPLSTIERMEVSPATAVAIYGGRAAGRVNNVDRKKNYRGLDLTARYSDRSTTFWGSPDSLRRRPWRTSKPLSA
jgi:iron complex outermembrane receptor protein